MTDITDLQQAIRATIKDTAFIQELATAVSAVSKPAPAAGQRIPADQFTPEDVLVPRNRWMKMARP